MPEPLLSVVVPLGPGMDRVLNIESWLNSALEVGIEVIIVHDSGNHDELSAFQRIVAQNQLKNLIYAQVSFGNPGETRNAGMALATGKWISFWDSDDTPLVKTFIEMVKFADSINADTSVGGFQVQKSTTAKISQFLPLGKGDDLLAEFAAFPGIWRFAFRRSRILNTRFNAFRMGEDQAFLIEALGGTQGIYVHEKIVYQYSSESDNQLTSSTEFRKEILNSIKWLQSMNGRLSKHPLYHLIIASQILTTLKAVAFNEAARVLGTELRRENVKIFVNIVKVLRIRKRIKRKNNNVIVYLTGGLGNQMFQISRALQAGRGGQICIANYQNSEMNHELLAHLKKNSFYFQENSKVRTAVNKVLVSRVLRSTSGSKQYLGGFNYFFLKLLSKVVNGWNTNLERVSNIGFEAESKKSVNVFIGYFQSYKYVDKDDFLSNLNLNFSKQFDSKLAEYHKLAVLETPILVHIRLGDYRNENKFGALGKEYYLRALQILESEFANSKIWLFSDEPTEAIKVFPPQLREKMRIMNDYQISSFENLQIMRLCSNYVIANSTYSWWAAFLSYSKNPKVIYPNPWFKNLVSPNLITPSDWTPLTGYTITKPN
jgi:hypothetical protein